MFRLFREYVSASEEVFITSVGHLDASKLQNRKLINYMIRSEALPKKDVDINISPKISATITISPSTFANVKIS